LPEIDVLVCLANHVLTIMIMQAVCKDLGITMIAYSPLALGLLSGQ
jgi:aryl-alcohol dehydrogenase-like predicted oxidoreductase